MRRCWFSPRPIIEFIVVVCVYSLLSFVFFGLHLYPDFSHQYLGMSQDPITHIWLISYWHYVFSHGLNPLFTRLVWAGVGVDMTHMQANMGLGLVNYIFNIHGNSVVIYNVWVLASVVLSAATAFIVCRYMTKSLWSAVVGGYLYGFSTYMIGQMLAHLVCLSTFLFPLIVLTYLLFFNKIMSRWLFCLLMALLIVLQFLFMSELLIDFTVIAGVAILVSFFIKGDIRRRVLQTLPWIIVSYLIALLVVSPYLYYFFAIPGRGFAKSLVSNSIALANFIIPTPITWLGGNLFAKVSSHFPANIFESGGYLGLPLLAIIALFALEFWRQAYGKILVVVFVAACFISFGPYFHLSHAALFPIPWTWVAKLPIIQYALPARFMFLAFLAAALIVSLWLAKSATKPIWKIVLAVLAIVFLLPNPNMKVFQHNQLTWTTPFIVPKFVTDGSYKQLIKKDSVVMALPDWYNGCVFQLKTNFYFRYATKCRDGHPYPQKDDWFFEAMQSKHVAAVIAAKSRTVAEFQQRWTQFVTNTKMSLVIIRLAYWLQWQQLLPTYKRTQRVGDYMFVWV